MDNRAAVFTKLSSLTSMVTWLALSSEDGKDDFGEDFLGMVVSVRLWILKGVNSA
jgi:hypothetical protein